MRKHSSYRFCFLSKMRVSQEPTAAEDEECSSSYWRLKEKEG